MPLLKKLSRTSRDSFESDSDSKESRDDRLNSPKSGKKSAKRPEILSNQIPVRKNSGTFSLISSKVAFCVFLILNEIKELTSRK